MNWFGLRALALRLSWRADMIQIPCPTCGGTGHVAGCTCALQKMNAFAADPLLGVRLWCCHRCAGAGVVAAQVAEPAASTCDEDPA